MAFGLSDRPIQDGAVRAALDEDIVAPLQALTGGVWGLGVWRRYLLSSLKWATLQVGTTISVPANAGTLGIMRIGDNSMLFSVDASGGIDIVGLDVASVLMRLPDGIQYACRQPVDLAQNDRACAQPMMILDEVLAVFDPGYCVPGSPYKDAVVFARQSTNAFVAGRRYQISGQWIMEVAVAQHRA